MITLYSSITLVFNYSYSSLMPGVFPTTRLILLPLLFFCLGGVCLLIVIVVDRRYTKINIISRHYFNYCYCIPSLLHLVLGGLLLISLRTCAPPAITLQLSPIMKTYCNSPLISTWLGTYNLRIYERGRRRYALSWV